MMKLPLELVIPIIEQACFDDFGRTARCVGLVSKDLRAIAEPLELRSIAVSGIKQLEGLTVRLDNAREKSTADKSHRMPSGPIKVQHLFISELTEEHASALEVPPSKSKYSSSSKRANVYEPEAIYLEFLREWAEMYDLYAEDAEKFWRLSSALVASASPTLKSLSLLVADGWFEDRFLERKASGKKYFQLQKVLGCLSGISFPNLVYLAIDHDLQEGEIYGFSDAGSRFQPIDASRLRRLRVRSPNCSTYSHENGLTNHPLLDNFPAELVVVTITGRDAICRTMEVMYEGDWRRRVGHGALPGKLRSLVLRQDFLPRQSLDEPYQRGFVENVGHLLERMRRYVEDVEKLHIDGLEVRLPYWTHLPEGSSDSHHSESIDPYWARFPTEEQQHFKSLLDEWQAEVQASENGYVTEENCV